MVIYSLEVIGIAKERKAMADNGGVNDMAVQTVTPINTILNYVVWSANTYMILFMEKSSITSNLNYQHYAG